MSDTPYMKPRASHLNLTNLRLAALLMLGVCGFVIQTACGDPVSVPNPADMVLHVVSGDSQVGVPFEELPEPIVVQVVDTANNQPVFNQVINFRVVEGGGSVYAGVAHTNE